MEKKLRIGTRSSPLALKQVEEIIKKFSLKEFEIKTYNTKGDKDRETPVSDIEGSDFFTDAIDSALLKNEIECAVHSAKDLPNVLPGSLKIALITEPLDSSDVLVSKNNLKLSELPLNARIGASSIRRKEQLKKFRSDFQIVNIRGNIEERLEKFERYGLDGMIVAACALIRLGLENKIVQKIPFEILSPHPLQGSLAVVVRKNDYETEKIFKK
ncbi:MAG: hydroxymethylbilane synthase [Elusimicrobiota bacterium]|nr:hydroxymethylbilane synthase [Elusimicrobiota bacterium]